MMTRGNGSTMMYQRLVDTLIKEHRSSVAEWSGNMGGHVAIRDGWVEYDEETEVEECETCDLIIEALPYARGLRA